VQSLKRDPLLGDLLKRIFWHINQRTCSVNQASGRFQISKETSSTLAVSLLLVVLGVGLAVSLSSPVRGL